jgi:lipoyl(octanoyl) transferase
MTGHGSETRRRGLLRAYLLGSLDFDEVLALQNRLVFQLRAGRPGGALVLCEHPPLITVGRHGGPWQIHAGRDELASRRWQVRWVPRGGGTILHLPGQLAIYPVFSLDRLGLGVEDYLDRLQDVLVALLADFGIAGHTRPEQAGVWVGQRLIAAVGVAVRHQVSTFGAVLNIDPDLTLFRLVQTGGSEDGPMTSLARERRGALRPALVRQRWLEHFAERFGFEETDLVFHPPGQPGHERLPPRPKGEWGMGNGECRGLGGRV